MQWMHHPFHEIASSNYSENKKKQWMHVTKCWSPDHHGMKEIQGIITLALQSAMEIKTQKMRERK